MKKDNHKKGIAKAPDFVPAPTPSIMEMPIYDAGGRVKKYEEGGEVKDWQEPVPVNVADDSDFGIVDEVVKAEDTPVIDVVEGKDEPE